MSASGWYGFDLDGTLAYYDKWRGVDHIGAPIPEMVQQAQRLLRHGQNVKIFTARVHGHGLPDLSGGTVDAITPIKEWCKKHIGQELEVTNVKDFGMIQLYDDRAVSVKMNKGFCLDANLEQS